MRDPPLVGLANIMHRAGLYNDALIAANLALEISPRVVVTHFTLANIYASKIDLEKAKLFYIVSLTLYSYRIYFLFSPFSPRLLYNQHLNQLWKDCLQSSVMKNSVHSKIYKCCDITVINVEVNFHFGYMPIDFIPDLPLTN